jgi:hypothetical protein
VYLRACLAQGMDEDSVGLLHGAANSESGPDPGPDPRKWSAAVATRPPALAMAARGELGSIVLLPRAVQ